MKRSVLAVGLLFISAMVFEQSALATTSFLQRFKANSQAAMSLIPEKAGDRISPDLLDEKVTACRHDADREEIIQKSRATRARHGFALAPKTDQENPRLFLEAESILTSIEALDAYRNGVVDVKPWTGDYWALRNGGAARRYLDPAAPPPGAASTWQQGFDYFLAHPSNETKMDLLSPAEKYDRLVGDDNYTLANANWAEGKENTNEHGQVESWMGHCHGWAPASFMEPRPTHSAELKSYKSGEAIVFRPDDLKALATLKWASGINVKNDRSDLGTKFMGTRCTSKNPTEDPDTGRLLDQDCFDLNPGAWHQVIINQVGIAHRPFVIDAAYDYEVWNQPVVSYQFEYFNPITFENTQKLADARVKVSDPNFHDKFLKFRKNDRAVEIVGVIMTISYVVEARPRGEATDSPEKDLRTTVRYHYDLELDANGEILGGEWYQHAHPDFIWMPVKDSTALNKEDLSVNSIETAMVIAPQASKSTAPLRFVLDQLLKLASL